MKGVYTYHARPYDRDVLFTKTQEGLAWMCKRFNVASPLPCAGAVLRTEDGPLLLVVVDGKESTLVHECGHATMFVLEAVGIDPTDSNGEAFCYLLEDMYTHMKARLLPHHIH